MKYKIFSFLYILFLLIFGLAMGKSNKIIDPNLENQENINNSEVNNINDLTEEIENTKNVDLNLTKMTYNNYTLAYGDNNNHPYLAVIANNEKVEYTFNDLTGSISKIIDKTVYATIEFTANNEKISKNYLITEKELIPYEKKQLTINYTKNTTITPKYLVIHETANKNIGANAYAHYRYWSTNQDAKASTHFVVDTNEIYQMLELNQMAWHVGDNKGYSNITNNNSIGIEICVNQDGNYQKARENAIKLAIQIMNELNMSIDQLKTHHDASGKNCPTIMLANNLWDDFVYQVSLGLKK